MNIPISNRSLRDFLNCRYKSHLKLLGHSGWESGFESMCNCQMADYRKLAQTHLSRSLPASGVCHKPASLLNAIRGGYALLVDANTTVDDRTYHFVALLRITDAPETPKYTPVLYVPAEKITPHDQAIACDLRIDPGRSTRKRCPVREHYSRRETFQGKGAIAQVVAAGAANFARHR